MHDLWKKKWYETKEEERVAPKKDEIYPTNYCPAKVGDYISEHDIAHLIHTDKVDKRKLYEEVFVRR